MGVLKQIKKALVALLCLAMIFGAFNVQSFVIKAKPKSTLWYTKSSISIGKQDYGISIRYEVKGATYTYTSSNKKVVTVSKDGILTGVKAGKAKITVMQNYKGKNTKVGICSVEVKAATLERDYYEVNYYKGDALDYNYSDYDANNWWIFEYKVKDAKYTYTPSDPDVLEINSDGLITKLGQPGESTTVTVIETYKKKTRTIGKITVKICVPTLSETEVEVGLGQYIYPFDYVTGYTGKYSVVCSDSANPVLDNSDVGKTTNNYDASDDVLDFVIEEDGSWWLLQARKYGTAYVHYYMTSDEISADTYIGTIKFQVNYMKATSLTWKESYDTIIDGVIQEEYDEEDDKFYLFYSYMPEYCNDTVTVTSSNTNVATIGKDTYSDDGVVELIVKGEGTTTITVKLGDYAIKKKICYTKYKSK